MDSIAAEPTNASRLITANRAGPAGLNSTTLESISIGAYWERRDETHKNAFLTSPFFIFWNRGTRYMFGDVGVTYSIAINQPSID